MPEFYISKTCPYCKKVLDFLKNANIKYFLHDISNSSELKKLIELGGKNQVPFMYDKNNDIKMYESDDIIKYLKSLAG